MPMYAQKKRIGAQIRTCGPCIISLSSRSFSSAFDCFTTRTSILTSPAKSFLAPQFPKVKDIWSCNAVFTCLNRGFGSWVHMRTVAMCYSLFQFPRCRIHTLANSWWERIDNCRTGGNRSSFRLFGSNNYGLEGKYTTRSTRRAASTTPEGRSKNSLSSKTTDIRHEIFDETIATSIKLNINKSEERELEKIQYCDIQQKITQNRDLAKLITVIVFDIETTGFSRQHERIIEIALQDLVGGENSTFQTLINPERHVPNPHVHGISTNMVNRSSVPRMEDLIPILLKYVRSRQKPGGYVLWIAHNARCFDVPFLIEEFTRCSYEVPSEWLFLDTLPLAREVMKSGGSNLPSKISLQALLEYYGIPLVGSAHRAMSDVNSLSLILQRMTFDLKIPLSGLVERSFRASDLIKPKKKKS